MTLKAFKFIFLPSFIFIITSSCTTGGEKLKSIKELEKAYNTEHTNNRAYLFLPLEGCGDCIAKTVTFVQQNIEKEDIVFVVSSISQKNINMSFSIEMTSRKNFINDTKQIAYPYGLIKNRPVIYLIKNGKVNSTVELDDKNSEHVLLKLQYYLDQEQ